VHLQCIFILDEDTIQYDLATPLGVYNYATFLGMLTQKHAPNLVERIMKVASNGSELSGKDWSKCEWIRDDWTMTEQISWVREQGYVDDSDC